MNRKISALTVVIAFLLLTLPEAKASTVNVQSATFESGWDGWESVGGPSSYQRGTAYAHWEAIQFTQPQAWF